MGTYEVFAPAGAIRDQLDAVDWASTPLGSPDTWDETLGSAVRLVMATGFPATLLWGPEKLLIYNEAYVDLIGAKHPQALGRGAREVFPEAWSVISPLFDHVYATGRATWVTDQLVPLERHGYLEDCYFIYSYSPVFGEDGAVVGVLDLVNETTAEVINRRRLHLLARLRDTLSAVEHGDDTPHRVLELLREYPDDLDLVDFRAPGAELPTEPRLPDRPATATDSLDELTTEATPAGTVVWLPLATVDGGGPAYLVVRLNPRLAPDGTYLDFLRLIATTVAASMARREVLAQERRVAIDERTLSEALQRSLLAEPVRAAGVELEVRYRPAADHVQIGGDWYDSFVAADGALTLVIGDVAGHDRQAAAVMAQTRNMLRGLAYVLAASPGPTMTAFDAAITGLEVDAFVTAVLARLAPADVAGGPRELRWTNAGHPPPALVAPDGVTSFLDTDAQPLLGLLPGSERGESAVSLAPGSTVVLYTDGLVERREEHLDVGLARLREELTGCHAMSPAEIGDHLVARMGADGEDDVAVMVLRLVAP